MHGRPKLAARKSPSPDNRERKRPRLFKSPQPGFPSRDVTPSPKTPEVKQDHEAQEASTGIFRTPPTPVDVQYQPAGPSPDVRSRPFSSEDLGFLSWFGLFLTPFDRPTSFWAIPLPQSTPRADLLPSIQHDRSFLHKFLRSPGAPWSCQCSSGHHQPAWPAWPAQPSSSGAHNAYSDPRPRQSPYETPWKKLTVTTVDFEELSAHTAKCDLCDRRNTEGMWRCTPCGWQCCRRCLAERGGDRSHPKAGTIHYPRDMVQMSSLAKPNEGPSSTAASASRRRVRPSRASRGTPNVSADEQAARLLSTMREDYQDRRRQLPTPAANESNDAAAPQRAAGTDGEMGVNGAQGLQDFKMHMDLDNLPDHLVNVRRNPSRRARPADLKE
ncbi:hypothetical protein N7539_000921 [Penicillium diatomitis]|uniref:Uncharacterized protein n=1 Tax=Penicillium diatomitis TaxID=2819901 RepID=A0A9X0C342_9EURO|nr:uncharacterized protein N7539_000921 [Penicillium diatomitis]KAJ5495805.1 hypothetical protein N7539_000921 [Penicillium diatomitis]